MSFLHSLAAAFKGGANSRVPFSPSASAVIAGCQSRSSFQSFDHPINMETTTMSDSDIVFESQTPRHGLPLLFAGQAQKEGFVNESLSRIDALLHCAIEGQSAVPPANPIEGQCWLVASGASGAWFGKAGQIAAFESGNWLFIPPRDGMRLLNRASGQDIRHQGSWQAPARPALPSGGTTIDNEARATIAALLQCLTNAGIIPES